MFRGQYYPHIDGEAISGVGNKLWNTSYTKIDVLENPQLNI